MDNITDIQTMRLRKDEGARMDRDHELGCVNWRAILNSDIIPEEIDAAYPDRSYIIPNIMTANNILQDIFVNLQYTPKLYVSVPAFWEDTSEESIPGIADLGHFGFGISFLIPSTYENVLAGNVDYFLNDPDDFTPDELMERQKTFKETTMEKLGHSFFNSAPQFRAVHEDAIFHDKMVNRAVDELHSIAVTIGSGLEVIETTTDHGTFVGLSTVISYLQNTFSVKLNINTKYYKII